MKGKLIGKNLKVVSINRQGVENAQTCFYCDNCGKAIVNYANVKDEFKTYIIGLDCKKSLIDKLVIDNLLKGDLHNKYEAKVYSRNQNFINKFLLESSRENRILKIDNGFISIYDTEKQNSFFPDLKGETILSESKQFLESLGLAEFINQKIKNQNETNIQH